MLKKKEIIFIKCNHFHGQLSKCTTSATIKPRFWYLSISNTREITITSTKNVQNSIISDIHIIKLIVLVRLINLL